MGENTRNHYYNVDLNKPLSKRYSGLLLASGDNNGDVFHFAISKDGVNIVDNDSVTFTAFFIRGDDITVTPEVVKENGVVRITLDDTCYRREGRFVLTVKSTLSGNTTTIAIVDGYIRQTDSGNYIADEEQTITLDKIQGMANDMAMFYEQAKEKMEELSGATENLENALDEAEHVVEKLPYIGDNGNWMQWDDDARKFIDSGSPSRGIPGQNGVTPVKGKDYFDGEPGYTPQKGIDYFDGEDGHSPVKGTDYWTAGDRAAIKAEALADLADVQTDGISAAVASLRTTVSNLDGRTSKLETKAMNMAEDISYTNEYLNDLEIYAYEYITKLGLRIVQIERHLGLTPPVHEEAELETTLPGIDDLYDELFPQE